MKHLSIVLALLANGLATTANSATVVELFTSHGCSSCPPADALLGELIENDPELVALEFHVDYWNDLVHGSAGNWVDPFSDAAWSQRQREYDHVGLEGRPGVYTPQMIVNGAYAAVGSDARRVRARLQDDSPADQVMLAMSRPAVDRLQVLAQNPDSHAGDVWLAIYDIRHDTDIRAGENQGVSMVNHHVVRRLERQGSLQGLGSQSFEIGLNLQPGQGCAVLVSGDRPGRFLGAGRCPASPL